MTNVKKIQLDKKQDALFNPDEFLIIHRDVIYKVNPLVFIRFSKRFINEFSDNTSGLKDTSDFPEATFSQFVDCCQGKEVTLRGKELVNLLVIAADWKADTLVDKIEKLIREQLSPNDILDMYSRLTKDPFPLGRLETIISNNISDYLDNPLFPRLPLDVIRRILSNAPKLSAYKVVKLCFALAEFHGMEAITIISSKTFDNVDSVEEVKQLSDLFGECRYDGFSSIFKSIGRCIDQIISPEVKKSQFDDLWLKAEYGSAKDAYDFFTFIQKEEDQEPKSESAAMFLKLSADRGYPQGCYEWGKYLLRISRSQFEHQSAIEYLIHAAARGHQKARAALRPYIGLSQISRNNRQSAYESLSLQIYLMNMTSENSETTSMAISSFPFTKSEEGVSIITDNILKALLVRQRNIKIYANLIRYLMDRSTEENRLSYVKRSLFTKIIVALCIPEPRIKQFVYTRFLYVCFEGGVFTDEELSKNISDFIVKRPQFIKSSLLLFYWFAPLITNSDAYTLVTTQLIEFKGGMGNLDQIIVQFKSELEECVNSKNWNNFYQKRKVYTRYNRINEILLNDDVLEIENIKEIDQVIENDCFDLDNEGLENLTLVQYAAIQGSINCFMALIQRGAKFLQDDTNKSSICAIAGQCFFIMNFCFGLEGSIRDELFRASARFDNIYALSIFLQIGVDVNSRDEKKLTAIHNAVLKGNIDAVKFLLTVDDVDANARDINLASPLHYAVWNDDTEIAKILVSCHGVDPNIKGSNNRTPLHEAVKNGFVEMLMILTSSYGININCEDVDGITPFHLSAKRGHEQIVRFLANLPDIDLECRTKKNETAADIAKTKEIKELINSTTLGTLK